MKVLIVTHIKDIFNPKVYGSVKALHDNENITKNNLKMNHRALLVALKNKDSWTNGVFFIKKETVIRIKNQKLT